MKKIFVMNIFVIICINPSELGFLYAQWLFWVYQFKFNINYLI